MLCSRADPFSFLASRLRVWTGTCTALGHHAPNFANSCFHASGVRALRTPSAARAPRASQHWLDRISQAPDGVNVNTKIRAGAVGMSKAIIDQVNNLL
jgi:hypothetical protein